jgi:hypothetical protein
LACLNRLSALKSVEAIERSSPRTAQLLDGLDLDFGTLEKAYGRALVSEEGFPDDREILAHPQKQFPVMFQGRICPVLNLLLPLWPLGQ